MTPVLLYLLVVRADQVSYEPRPVHVAEWRDCERGASVGLWSTTTGARPVFTSGDMSVRYEDVPTDVLRVVVTSGGRGIMTLQSVSGLLFSVGDGKDDPAIEFSGCQEDVNAALRLIVVREGSQTREFRLAVRDSRESRISLSIVRVGRFNVGPQIIVPNARER